MAKGSHGFGTVAIILYFGIFEYPSQWSLVFFFFLAIPTLNHL